MSNSFADAIYMEILKELIQSHLNNVRYWFNHNLVTFNFDYLPFSTCRNVPNLGPIEIKNSHI